MNKLLNLNKARCIIRSKAYKQLMLLNLTILLSISAAVFIQFYNSNVITITSNYARENPVSFLIEEELTTDNVIDPVIVPVTDAQEVAPVVSQDNTRAASCGGFYDANNPFPCCTNNGNCTWWAAYKRPDLAQDMSGSGNAQGWWQRSTDRGYPRGQTPQVGAIAAWGVSSYYGVGHVAYVEQVIDENTFVISEMNCNFSPNYNPSRTVTKTTHANFQGFIYKKLTGAARIEVRNSSGQYVPAEITLDLASGESYGISSATGIYTASNVWAVPAKITARNGSTIATKDIVINANTQTTYVVNLNIGQCTRSGETTQACTIESPNPTQPYNGDVFNATQSITLGWSEIGGSEYYGEVWGGPEGTTTFGWQGGTLANIGTRTGGYTYNWHVKARNSNGTSNWSPTWSFSVLSPGDSTKPTGRMTSPTKGSTQWGPNILLKADASDTGSGVKRVEFFAWSGDSWSNEQWIHLGTDTSAPYEYNWDVSDLGSSTSAFVTINIFDNANNSSGYLWDPNWTDFSIRNLTAPTNQTLILPSDGASFMFGDPIAFSWDRSEGATEYLLEITGGFLTNTPLSPGWISDTNYSYLNTLDVSSNPYYWRVKARNSVGESAWSVTRSLTVRPRVVPPSAPTLVSPENNSSFYDDPMIPFTWVKDNNATHYQLEIYGAGLTTNYYFGWTTKNDISVTPGLSANTQPYYWRVRGKNLGGTGAWSTPRSFYVVPLPTVPAAPTLISPINNRNYTIGEYTEFSWNSVTNASKYYLEITGGTLSSPINAGWVTETSVNYYTYLESSNLPYYWRVKARNNVGEGNWSESRTFKVSEPTTPPSAPVITDPTPGTILKVDQIISAVWTGNGREYYAEISGGVILPSGSGWIADTNYRFGTVPGGHTYNIRVKARNSAGESGWSSFRSFFVGDCALLSSSDVMLFSENNCRSTSHTVTVGFSNLTAFNNTARSIYVPSAKSIRVWAGDNRTSSTKCFSSNNYSLMNYTYEDGVPIVNNDVPSISSVEVFNNTTCTPAVVITGCAIPNFPGVIIYNNTSCSGNKLGINVTKFTKLVSPMNNSIKSVYVNTGWSVKIFQNKDKTGGKLCITATKDNLAGLKYNNGTPVFINGKSTVSAIKVYRSSNCK